MDKTDALRIKITEIVKEGNGVSEISDSQKNIIFDLIKGKKNLYYLSYNRKQQQKEKDESMIILPEGLQEYTVLVIDSPNAEVQDIPKEDIIYNDNFTWSEGEGTFFILNKTYKLDGTLVGRDKTAGILEALGKPPLQVVEENTVVEDDPTKGTQVVEERKQVVKDNTPEENKWELLSTKVQEKDFDKYYLPLLNLISEQHFNGILTGKFEAKDVEVQGDEVKFVANKGNIFQYKLNEENKLEGCNSKYPAALESYINDSCGVSLGKKRQEILDDADIRKKVKKLVYADLYNLYTIFGGTIFKDKKGIPLSEGNSKYSETTETLETVVESFK